MKQIVQLNVLDVKIFLLTNVVELVNYFLYDKEFVPETIPGYQAKLVGDSIDLSNFPVIEYENSENENVLIDTKQNKLFLSCKYEKLYKPDLVYYALCMFAKELNKKNMYFVHCSVVEKDGVATVLMGDSASGKTTLALYLCTEYGYNFVCNDRAIIGFIDNKPYVICGTLETYLRVGVIEKLFPKFKNELTPELLERPWNNKIHLNPRFDELGIKIVNNVEIGYMYFIFTYDSSEESAYIDRYLEDEKYYTWIAIQERISQYNRASRNIILSVGYPFPSFDNEELAQIRFGATKNISKNIKVADIRGTVKESAKMIFDEQFKKH